MDVREKLVYLVKNALRAYGKDLEKTVEPYEFIADFLIHSGVTVQEWVSVEDRLPEEKQRVLVRCKTIEWISAKDRLPEVGERVLTLDKWGHIHDRMLYQFVDGFISFRPDGLKPGREVTHWMPMPEPPKGE